MLNFELIQFLQGYTVIEKAHRFIIDQVVLVY